MITKIPRITVTKTLENIPVARLSHFLIEKTVSSRENSRTIKKIRSGYLFADLHNKNFLKLKRQNLPA